MGTGEGLIWAGCVWFVWLLMSYGIWEWVRNKDGTEPSSSKIIAGAFVTIPLALIALGIRFTVWQ